MSRNIRGNFLILLQCFCYKILAWMEKKKTLKLVSVAYFNSLCSLAFCNETGITGNIKLSESKSFLAYKYIYSVINDP